MDKVNSAKEMGSIYAGVLMFYVPVLYAIRITFLKKDQNWEFFFGLRISISRIIVILVGKY